MERPWLTKLRQKRSLTQEQLGERLAVSGVAVSLWESGHKNPSGKMMLRLAKHLGKEVLDLFAAEDDAQAVGA